MREARQQIHNHIDHSSAIMEQIRKILNPVQVAKFFVWVEQHQNSVQTLTTLWDDLSGKRPSEDVTDEDRGGAA